ncbi:hypothetical protein AMATHDRAFT_197265 [Amanita thiersii Skay4041]|uniref:Cyanovirin-N domain-containing protein n=1 Tax=Amanita thiersii Skay4041 TaxID=703135 RepID=A0A2A9NBH4_9AGAR|nr:hypothetical protein AMATHDRAFT_197265 [Amanita thiersii Skay4041]
MKFSSSFSLVILFCIASITGTQATPVESELQETRAVTHPNRLPSRDSDAGLIFCTGPDFQGTCTYNFPLTSGTCYANAEPYISNLWSSDSDFEHVCFLYTSGSCSDCEACVDVNGWSNMGSFAAIHSYRCVVADSSGCSNSNCRHR